MSQLKPFVSDGCSGGMSVLWRAVLKRPPPWEDLCVEHDRAYHAGGHVSLRKKADAELRDGILSRGYIFWGWAVYVGVRIGGVWWLPTPWRWGFGWDYPRYK